jgi:hypothetical protein
MTLVRIDRVGKHGVIKDVNPWELPLDAWSDGSNVRMVDGAVVKTKGYSTLITPSFSPFYLLGQYNSGTAYWLNAGLSSVSVYTAGVNTDITRASGGAYSMSESIGWNGGILNGIAILNNGVDTPQQWTATPSAATKLSNLSNWPASTTARVIRPFKNFLFALDVTESSTRYQRMVRWSHPADPGGVPSSWNYADETKDAGRVELSETQGACVDGLTLGDQFVIYKEDAIWGAQYIGPPLIFRFYPISRADGILARHCVAQFKGRHFVVSNGDVLVHVGGEMQSILSGKMRRYLFNAIDSTYYYRSFVAPNPAYNEMLFFYPESGDTYPTKVLAWNWETGAISLRDVDLCHFAAFGVLGVGSTYTPSAQRVLMTTDTPEIQVLDNTEQADGSNMTAYVERRAISIPNTDQEAIKFCRRVYVRVAGTGTLNVYVAGTMEASETPSYGTANTLTIGTDKWIDCLVSGRFLNIKFESTGDQTWTLDGYDLDVDPVGMR